MTSTTRFEQHPSFAWEVRGFQRLLSLESPDFFMDSACYRLKLGFGHTPCDGKCVQVRLERVSGELKKYYVCLDISRENLKKGYKPFRSFVRIFDKGVACVFLVPVTEWSKPDEELLKDGTVKIICTVDDMEIVTQDPDKRKRWFGINSSTELLSTDFRNLLFNGRYSDLVIKCGNRNISGHSLVLFARSRMFEKMLLDCEDGVLELDAADEPVFAHLLSYIYSGQIGDSTKVCLSKLCEAAARYRLEELKTKCFLAMRARLGKDNVYEYLSVSDTLSNFDFKTAAITYLVETDEMLNSDEFKEFFQKNSGLGNEVLRACLDKKTKRLSMLRQIKGR